MGTIPVGRPGFWENGLGGPKTRGEKREKSRTKLSGQQKMKRIIYRNVHRGKKILKKLSYPRGKREKNIAQTYCQKFSQKYPLPYVLLGEVLWRLHILNRYAATQMHTPGTTLTINNDC